MGLCRCPGDIEVRLRIRANYLQDMTLLTFRKLLGCAFQRFLIHNPCSSMRPKGVLGVIEQVAEMHGWCGD